MITLDNDSILKVTFSGGFSGRATSAFDVNLDQVPAKTARRLREIAALLQDHDAILARGDGPRGDFGYSVLIGKAGDQQLTRIFNNQFADSPAIVEELAGILKSITRPDSRYDKNMPFMPW